MSYLIFAVSLVVRDMGRLFLGIGEKTELQRMAEKERRDLGLPY